MARICNRIKSQRGTALIEAALTLPLILLVSVVIFEFARAFETWQIMTNAAREGARVAVLPNPPAGGIQQRVKDYLLIGAMTQSEVDTVTINVNQAVPISFGAGTAMGSQVTLSYPFSFIVLNPVARLVVSSSTLGNPITLTTSAVMRNEAQ